MSRATTVHLDLEALVHNLQRVRAAAPGRKAAVAVKAEAYGHGLVRVAQTLDADAFAVACIEAVSYTHLDVYKRQLKALGSLVNRIMCTHIKRFWL